MLFCIVNQHLQDQLNDTVSIMGLAPVFQGICKIFSYGKSYRYLPVNPTDIFSQTFSAVKGSVYMLTLCKPGKGGMHVHKHAHPEC